MKSKISCKPGNSARLIPTVMVVAIFVGSVCSCRTNNSIHSHSIGSIKVYDSVLADNDGNKYPVKVLSDNNLWMLSNLNLNIPDSWCYENASENCKQYGRLYTWESAKQGCKLLGEGWRLPANAEWLQLTMLYGGAAGDLNASRKGAFKALLYTGGSGFNALLGGGRSADNQYARLDAHGFYWTTTGIDSSSAWYFNFAKGSQALYQQDGGEKDRAFSVRCVKSIGLLK